MSKELYFIPIIVQAFQRTDREPALREAFDRIIELGRDERFRVGYRQFLRFMECSLQQWVEDAFGSPQGREAFEAPIRGEVVLERDGDRLGSWTIAELPVQTNVVNVRPGYYRLAMDTGWVLWEENLTAKELVFAQAFPDQGLPLAAQTDEAALAPTREVSLLNGSLTIHVLAGLEHGVLELSFQ
jgi:hypothetical protein